MKSIKILTLVAFCMACFAVTSNAESCCEKAKKAGKTCEHKCCVEAAKDKKVCEKCNPKEKKEDKK